MVKIKSIDSLIRLISELEEDKIYTKILVDLEEEHYDRLNDHRLRFKILVLSSVGQFYFKEIFSLSDDEDLREIEDIKKKISIFKYSTYKLDKRSNDIYID